MTDNTFVQNERKPNVAQKGTVQALLTIVFSFMIAFFLQLLVHELGHYIMGLLLGASDGNVVLHPFSNSKVIFTAYPNLSTEVIVGISGIIFDLVIALP